MRFAFGIFKYFPHGGLQKDMLRMAEEALARGHQVCVFTRQWIGEIPAGLELRYLKPFAFSNHGKARVFEKAFCKAIQAEHFDCIICFNRMAGGDFYFAADNCQAWELPQLHSQVTLKLLPRYRTFLQMEARVCNPAAHTTILIITPGQKNQYQSAYPLPDECFQLLPPGMNPNCRRPENAEEIRLAKRRELGLKDDELMLLLVGSDFQRKGGDRVVNAIAALPLEIRQHIQLYLVGNCKPRACGPLSVQLGLASQTHFTGGRDDVPALLQAADLMVHPARSECTGTVLIEGLAAGLPVICSAACGFSNYVGEANPSLVTPEPFRQEALNSTLLTALQNLPQLQRRTIQYATNADFYRRAEVAVDLFEAKVRLLRSC